MRARRSSGGDLSCESPVPRPFRLSKYYLDCVNERGEALIAYWAELRWRRLGVRYATIMIFSGGRLCETSSLRGGPAPQYADGSLAWTCKPLGASGVWEGGGQPSIERVLYRRGEGSIRWRCIQPLAKASVRICEHQIQGMGYTEEILLTLAPWDLPLEELRWGRAHFPGRSVVWIDWKGPEPRKLVFVDAMEADGVRLSDDFISTSKIRVSLVGRKVLREGPVGGTSVGNVPGVRQALARHGLLLDEHKWLSSATLEDGSTTLHGNAIHEVVKWR